MYLAIDCIQICLTLPDECSPIPLTHHHLGPSHRLNALRSLISSCSESAETRSSEKDLFKARMKKRPQWAYCPKLRLNNLFTFRSRWFPKQALIINPQTIIEMPYFFSTKVCYLWHNTPLGKSVLFQEVYAHLITIK